MRTHFIVVVNIIKCKNCGREREHQGKGYCITCYKKIAWVPKKIICKRCKREKSHHSKGLCSSCYNFIFHSDKTKAWNHRKNYGLNIEAYKRITSKCSICGFDKVVDLHHLDSNKKNNSETNLIGLCPNHHKMLHDFRYKKEIFEVLKEKGYKFPQDIKLDFN
jgi:ribosomal protein L37E